MNPSAPLVLLTSVKINNYLKEQKQHESFISEAWVFKTLQTHIRNSIETGLIMSDAEVSDRVASIAIRRLQANITAASRFAKDQQYLYRPFDERNQDPCRRFQSKDAGCASLRCIATSDSSVPTEEQPVMH